MFNTLSRLRAALVAIGAASAWLAAPCFAAVNVKISELRVDHLGPLAEDDAEEYVELSGAPGTSLDGLTYIVIGDSSPDAEQYSGVVEAVIPLTGHSIGSNGLFVIAQPTFTLVKADLVVDSAVLNFEDNDNVSHFLVENFTGSLGEDLDPNDDSVIAPVPWTTLVSAIALVKVPYPSVGTEHAYGPVKIGPDSFGAPCHAYRGADCGVWQIGVPDVNGAADSPGAENPYCPTSPATTLFGLPHTPNGAIQWYVTSYGDLYFMIQGPIAGISPRLTDVETGVTPVWQGEFLLPSMGDFAAGSTYTFKMRDDFDVLSTLTISEINSGDAALSLTQEICETCPLTVETIYEGQVVSSATFAAPYPAQLVQGALGSSQYNSVEIYYPSSQQLAAGELLTIVNGDVAAFTISGQPTTLATAIRMRLNGMPVEVPVHDNVHFTTNMAAPDFSVRSEALIANGVEHEAWWYSSTIAGGEDSDRDGEPDIVVNKDHLSKFPVTEVGVLLDRADVNLDGAADPSREFLATLKLGIDGALDDDAKFTAIIEPVGGGGAWNIGQIDLIAAPGQPLAVKAVFPGAGTTYITEILHKGAIVHSASNQSGALVANLPVASVLRDVAARLVRGGSGGGGGGGGVNVPQLSFTFNAGNGGLPFTLPDQSVHMGDEVRITAINPPLLYESIQRVHFTGTGLPGDTFSFIDDAIIVLDTCPADVAPWLGNGTVNVDDMLLVINNWGEHGSNPADITGNGVVDVDDLLAVINAWGSCE